MNLVAYVCWLVTQIHLYARDPCRMREKQCFPAVHAFRLVTHITLRAHEYCLVLETQRSCCTHLLLSHASGVLPVAKLKLMPKKAPEATALFSPHLSTLFTATSYLAHAACSLANDLTCKQQFLDSTRRASGLKQ